MTTTPANSVWAALLAFAGVALVPISTASAQLTIGQAAASLSARGQDNIGSVVDRPLSYSSFDVNATQEGTQSDPFVDVSLKGDWDFPVPTDSGYAGYYVDAAMLLPIHVGNHPVKLRRRSARTAELFLAEERPQATRWQPS